ncbi:MAG: hypothetical protein ACI935_004140, partial [Moritella dasanensis]
QDHNDRGFQGYSDPFVTITSMLKVPSIIDKIERCVRMKTVTQVMLIIMC